VLDKMSFHIRSGERVGIGRGALACVSDLVLTLVHELDAREVARALLPWPYFAAFSRRAKSSTTVSPLGP
jgi:hypothetical protein